MKEYDIIVENDELVVTDDDGELFAYNPKSKESQRVQETLFHEKQTIIENCLFGVDINPNSVKICRLRLWIELLKNAYYKAPDFTELETLPNIDINIKCGNSLISRYALDADIKKLLKSSKWSINSYRIAVASYRNAKSKEEKRELESLILKIKQDFTSEIRYNDPLITRRDKLANELYNRFTGSFLFEPEAFYGKKDKEIEKKREKEKAKLEEEINSISKKIEEIKYNKIYENSFEWRFEFPEVLNDDGDFEGFDVVIGNPPYGAELGEIEKKVYKEKFSEFHTRWTDTFNYFIPLGFSISINKSIIAFILPNNILYQNEYEKSRIELISNHKLLIAYNLGDDVFKDASVPTSIIIASSVVENNYKFLYLDLREKVKNSSIFFDNVPLLIESNDVLKSSSKIIGLSHELSSFFNKLSINTCSINDIAFEVANGIQPTGDKIFRITESNIIQHSIEPEILKKVLVGGDFSRYSNPSSDHFVIYTTKETNITAIPNTIKYLELYKEKLSSKRETLKGTLPWWCLHWPRYTDLFEKPKIILRQTSDKLIATIDYEGFYTMNNVIIIQLPFDSEYLYKYILSLLNSKLFNLIYQNITQEKERIFAEVKPINIRKLPIKNIKKEEQLPFIDLVDRIIELKQKGENTTSLEAEIDQLVYQLYELSEEEIRIVEGTSTSLGDQELASLGDL